MGDTTPTTPGWLNKFLGRRRVSLEDVGTVPEAEALDNTWLQDFQDSASKVKRVYEIDSDSDDTALGEVEVEGTEMGGDGDDDDSRLDSGVPTVAHPPVELKLFNLPYHMTAEMVTRVCLDSGVRLLGATMDMDTRTARPAGSATVVLDGLVDEDDVAEDEERAPAAVLEAALVALRDVKFGGRIGRVQKVLSAGEQRERRRLSGGGDVRYFSENISLKCHLCGQVGHRKDQCDNAPLPQPCHLCGETDHEPQDCSNIVCFRCNTFGHHSRQCNSGGRFGGARPVLCTRCGSFTHEVRWCRITADSPVPEALVSRQIVCINCREVGHAYCTNGNDYLHGDEGDAEVDLTGSTSGVSTSSGSDNDSDSVSGSDSGGGMTGTRSTVPSSSSSKSTVDPNASFCPNCGLPGHHVDMPPSRNQSTDQQLALTCRAPRMEAYSKFQDQLMRATDGPVTKLGHPDDGRGMDGDVGDLMGLYVDMSRQMGRNQAQDLFPLLKQQDNVQRCSGGGGDDEYDNRGRSYDRDRHRGSGGGGGGGGGGWGGSRGGSRGDSRGYSAGQGCRSHSNTGHDTGRGGGGGGGGGGYHSGGRRSSHDGYDTFNNSSHNNDRKRTRDQ